MLINMFLGFLVLFWILDIYMELSLVREWMYPKPVVLSLFGLKILLHSFCNQWLFVNAGFIYWYLLYLKLKYSVIMFMVLFKNSNNELITS